MHSAIYEGWVRHRRFEPITHKFSYRLFMLYLDLDELSKIFERNLFWSIHRFNLAYLRRADHLGDVNVPLDQAVRELVRQNTGRAPTGPIRVLTHLRYFGVCFNPVSFFFCFDHADFHLETTVAEVRNTPWLERHCYILDRADNIGLAPWQRYRLDKNFHVSPFMEMNMEYDWRFTEPAEHWRVQIMNYQNETKVFDVSMALRRRLLTPATLNRFILRYPFMTMKVITAIYWQALKLRRKGAPFYIHPKKQNPAINDGSTDD